MRALAVLLVALAIGSVAEAQETGGSFGGSSFDEPSGGGGGGGGGSSFDNSGSGSSGSSWADEQAERDRQRAEDERRRAEEEARRRAEEEAARRAAEEAARVERVRKLALPPADRIRELSFPAMPGPAVVATPVDDPTVPVPTYAQAWQPWPRPEPLAAVTFRVPTVYAREPMSPVTGACCGGPMLLLLVPLALFVTRRRDDWTRAAGPVAAAPPGAAFAPAPITHRARRVSVAFDWTSRAELQAALAQLPKELDLRSRTGLYTAAQRTAILLGDHAATARYATWEGGRGDVKSWFQGKVLELRARFKTEMVRNQDVVAGPDMKARANEGQGLVVVTMIVASKTDLARTPDALTRESIAAALRSLVPQRADDTLALEVVWSPAAENDRMSSLELESFYPELGRLDDGVGRRACAYCGAPFPAELGKCPTCGAPVS